MNTKHEFYQKYEFLQNNNIPCMLGFGVQGSVQLVRNKKTNKLVAIKKTYRKIVLSQIKIHELFNHQNIVKIIEYFINHETLTTFIVLQYVQNGNLLDIIRGEKVLNLKQILNLFKGICQGLKLVHQKGIIHRDIKAQNILIDKDYNPKICDFGCAIFNQTNKIFSSQLCGTKQYCAPEILMRDQGYDRKVDVWALGVVFYEVLQKKLPFIQRDVNSIINKMKITPQFSSNSPKSFVEIIKKMLKFSPQQRPQIKEVIQYLNTNKNFQPLTKIHQFPFHQNKKYFKEQQSLDSTTDQQRFVIIKQSIKQINNIQQQNEYFINKTLIKSNKKSQKINSHKIISLKNVLNKIKSTNMLRNIDKEQDVRKLTIAPIRNDHNKKISLKQVLLNKRKI